MDEMLFEGEYRGMPISIRKIREGDAPILLGFINTLSREQTYILYQGRQLTFEYEKQYVSDFVKKAGMGYAVKLMAFHNDTLIGVADVTRSEYEAEPHIGTFGLTVAKEWRGKGIGSLLMDKTLEEAQKNMTGIKIIRLGVFANNPIAEKMYIKRGFVKYGTLPKGLLHRGEYVDHILMFKKVYQVESL